MIRRVRRHRVDRPPARERAVLMVYEPRLRRVVDELERRGLVVLIVGRGPFDALFQKHLARYLQATGRGVGEYTLATYLRYPDERLCYLAACRRVTRLLKATFAADTVILPKYNDDYTLEMVQAFHDAGFRTIVYDREGTVTRRRLELLPPIVAQQAARCDVVATYNETHHAFFTRVFELARLPPPEILVMGNPASDDWFHEPALQRPHASTPCRERTILFFAFGEFSYVYDEQYLWGKDQVWRQLLTDIHDGLRAHLETHPDDTLIYKRGMKGNRDYWAASDALLSLPNARLVPNTESANALIAASDTIVAFQTTALVDAMHTDRRIIYCAWGRSYDELKAGLIDFEGFAAAGALLHARSAEELRRFLTEDERRLTVDLDARARIREQFTTNPDGRVASRFANWVAADVRLQGAGPVRNVARIPQPAPSQTHG